MVDSTSFFKEEVNREVFIFLVAIHFIILLCSVIGGTALCLVIATSKDLRSPVDIYLGNLSIGCVFTSLLGSILLDNALMDWTTGLALCKTVHYGVQTCLFAVTLILMAVTLERYFCACKPNSYHGNIFKRPYLVCFICWGISTLIPIPVLFLTELQSGNINSRKRERICVTMWPPAEIWQVYFFLVTCVFYLLPFITMFCIQRTTLLKLMEPRSTRSGGNRILNQRRQQVLCILIVVSGLHFILFFPYQILSILHYFDVYLFNLHIAWCIVVILKFIPSAVTSYICLARHEPLRKNLKELFSCFYGRKKTVENNQI